MYSYYLVVIVNHNHINLCCFAMEDLKGEKLPLINASSKLRTLRPSQSSDYAKVHLNVDVYKTAKIIICDQV